LIIGGLLALVCGLANSAAATLEKREVLAAESQRQGLALLAVLVRRPLWLAAMVLSFVAWVAEAGALALAPVPVVTTLRSAGRGGLVAAGHRWLGERFGKIELAGVALLALGGILTASSVANTHTAAAPLSDLQELLVAVATGGLALVLARSKSGIVLGATVGVLFVATGVYTKEVGDRFVHEGLAALPALAQTPGPWLMIALSVWAISLLQRAFSRANAATVAAASTTVSANGLIVAGVVLYHESLATGSNVIPLVIGLVISAVGAAALAIRGSAPTIEIPPLGIDELHTPHGAQAEPTGGRAERTGDRAERTDNRTKPAEDQAKPTGAGENRGSPAESRDEIVPRQR
jgi:hypothetical protein